MKLNLYLSIFLLLFGQVSNANIQNLSIINSQNLNSKGFGTISDVEIEITPHGLFVRTELIFTIGTTSNMGRDTDPLEAIMNFDLPANSYIEDSWLWLDDTHIISAEIIEKNKAIQIYEGIVSRKRDPSILYKVGQNKYQLHVFPLFKKVARKVKIVYTSPLTWNDNKAYVPLPIDLLMTSYNKPQISAIIHHNSIFTKPGIDPFSISSYVLGSTPGSVTVVLPSILYTDGTIELYYKVDYTKPLLNIYNADATGGYYEVLVPPLQPKVSRNVVIILDHPGDTYQTEDLATIKQHLMSSLIQHYSETDSFNIFYFDNNAIKSVSANWLPASNVEIITAFKSIPNNIHSDEFHSLFINAYNFCLTRPNAECILVSKSRSYCRMGDAQDEFDKIRNYFGSYNNNISVINYAIDGCTQQTIGNEIFYKMLSAASGGQYFQLQGRYFNTITRREHFDFDIPDALKKISWKTPGETTAFSLNIPSGGHFLFAGYDLNPYNSFNVQEPYLEIGKFYGTFPTSGNIDIQYILNNNLSSVLKGYTTVTSTDERTKKAWINMYLRDISNDPAYYNEALDSSLNNRILGDYTAFLALENGDTVRESKSLVSPLSVENVGLTETQTTIYPNPVKDILNIKSEGSFNKIEIYDVLGRLCTKQQFTATAKHALSLHGLMPGNYFLKIYFHDGMKIFNIKKNDAY